MGEAQAKNTQAKRPLAMGVAKDMSHLRLALPLSNLPIHSGGRVFDRTPPTPLANPPRPSPDASPSVRPARPLRPFGSCQTAVTAQRAGAPSSARACPPLVKPARIMMVPMVLLIDLASGGQTERTEFGGWGTGWGTTGWGTLLTTWNYLAARLRAFDIPGVETPTCRTTKVARSVTIRPRAMPPTTPGCNVPGRSSRTCCGMLPVCPSVSWGDGASFSQSTPSTTYCPASASTARQRTKSARSLSSRKMARRSIPRAITWSRTPGASRRGPRCMARDYCRTRRGQGQM